MENQANSKSIILNYGLYLGILSVLMSLMVYAVGDIYNPHWSVSVIGILISIALIVLAIKKYKDTNGGYISWGKSLKVGVGVTLISAVITIIYQQIFNHYIEPTFMQHMMDLQTQKMVDRGMTQEQIKSALEIGKKFQGPVISSAIGILVAAFIGFVISAIAGAIMKKTDEEQY